jgi:hypothetical protein
LAAGGWPKFIWIENTRPMARSFTGDLVDDQRCPGGGELLTQPGKVLRVHEFLDANDGAVGELEAAGRGRVPWPWPQHRHRHQPKGDKASEHQHGRPPPAEPPGRPGRLAGRGRKPAAKLGPELGGVRSTDAMKLTGHGTTPPCRGGQAGRSIGGRQPLAEPHAGPGQAEAGGVGADAERQGSLGRAQLRIGDQLQNLPIPGRHGAQRRLDMGRLPCGVDRGLDGLVLLTGEARTLPGNALVSSSPAGQRPVLVRREPCGDAQQPRGGRSRLGPVAASGPERGQEGISHQVGHVFAGRATVDPNAITVEVCRRQNIAKASPSPAAVAASSS